MKMIKEILEQAEERLAKHEERHDRLLGHVCSHYLINQNMEEALGGVRVCCGSQEISNVFSW